MLKIWHFFAIRYCSHSIFILRSSPSIMKKRKVPTPYLQCMLMQANVFAYIWYQEILPHQQI